MDKHEAESIYNSLLSYMKSNKLGWIAEQIEEEIALGHIETKKLSVPKRSSYDLNESFLDDDYNFFGDNYSKELPSYKSKKSNAVFVISTPYNEHEKLKLLIDSIEIGVIKLSEIVNTTLDFIQSEIQQGQLMFEPEADVKESSEITLEQAKNSYENSRKLIPLLSELRKEL